MLQYGDIIETLSIDEKLSILTDGAFLRTAHEQNESLPALSIASMSDYNDQGGEVRYPDYNALANAWDLDLVKTVARSLTQRARADGVNSALLPKANVRSNVYQDGATEDAYLSGTLIGAYAKAVEENGVTPILSTCALSQSDVAYADVKPNAKAIMEYYLKPFRIATRGKSDLAIATSCTHLKGEYENTNAELVRGLIETQIAGNNAFLVCERTSPAYAVARVNAGYPLCIKGHFKVLKEAVEYYVALHNAVELGVATAEELDQALRDGLALSEDAVDEAVDSVLEFAYRCQRKANVVPAGKARENKQTLVEFAEKTAVLLKNERNALPIYAHERVAVIGQLGSSVAEHIAREASAEYAGYADGYDIERNRADELITQAKSLAEKADSLIVFVGLGKQREETVLTTKCLQLPASQIALLETLSKLGKKIIAVVTGSGRVDMQFDSVADAVLLAPNMGTYGEEALTRLLFGKACPSGKLPFSIYDKPEERAKRERYYKDKGYNKVGSFIGYRRYDTEEDLAKYPFGHGLSYTQFAYSELRVEQNAVWIRVTNVGSREGAEIVQFYYGKADSKQVRAKKELFGYERVKLKAGESVTVRKELKSNDFSYYNAETGKWETEQGNYEIYVCSSVTDVRARGHYYVIGITPKASKEHVSDYLQGSSNIDAGGYFMDTNTKKVKYKSKAPLFGIITILLGIFSDVLGIMLAKGTIYFKDATSATIGSIAFILFNVLMVIGIVTWVKSGKNKRRFKEETENNLLERVVETEEKVEEPVPYDRLFIEEFGDVDEDEPDEEEEEKTEQEDAFVIKETVDYYHRSGFTFTDMQAELTAFLSDRGFVVEPTYIRALLSAMSVSRLVVIKADQESNVSAFLQTLNAFFGVKNYIDNAESYTSSDDLLYRNVSGSYEPTNFLRAVEDALTDDASMRIAHLTEVKLSQIGTYFTQFMRYIVKPETTYTVAVKNKSITDKTQTTAPNLWIFMSLSAEEVVEDIPAYIAETATFIKLPFASQDAQLQLEGRKVSMAQFLSFSDKARNRFELDESKWKRVDKLEEYVRARVEYRISNKLWQKMERYASAFLALGGDADETLDSMVAVKMLPTLLSAVKNNKKDGDEQFSHVLETILGEEKANVCRMVVDASGVDSNDKWHETEQAKAEKPKTRKKTAPKEPAQEQTAEGEKE